MDAGRIHDIRSPIANAISLLQLLSTDISADDMKLVTAATESCRHALSVVDNELGLVDLSDVIQKVADLRGNEIKFDIEDTGSEGEIQVSSVLSRVIYNVVDNAIKFGGSRVKIRYNSEYVRVSNDGEKIDPQLRSSIFLKGSKVGADKSGSGLGLYTSKKNMEKIGGDIQLDDCEETCFTITL